MNTPSLQYAGQISLAENQAHLFTAEGKLGVGSEGNGTSHLWKPIFNSAVSTASHVQLVIFDFLAIQYQWGDYLASFFVSVYQAGFRPSVLANGETLLALQSLNELSIRLPLATSIAQLREMDLSNWAYFKD